jgi:hypothetical protein
MNDDAAAVATLAIHLRSARDVYRVREVVIVHIPRDWRGQPIVLHAVDDATGWGGWLAVARLHAVPWWASDGHSGRAAG